MTVLETRTNVWEALAGRAPGMPLGPADADLWRAVTERLNPAKARPVLRAGVERAALVSVRDVPYVMLRSPDTGGRSCYLRLTAEEARLTELMSGGRTVAQLVAEFARISGRLAPDQVIRVVADLAANRMLEELPVDALSPLTALGRQPWHVRYGRGLLAVARGRRMAVVDIDRAIHVLYRGVGRWLFTKPALIVAALVSLVGLITFGWSWTSGSRSLFLTGGSYGSGALILLLLNVVALASHELGHALAVKHAGREVSAAGILVYFGIPSVFVDTSDVWMAGRRARLTTTAAGPAAGLVLAGLMQLVGLAVPAVAPVAFVLAFSWYLNALFNLNPLLALDGYYLLMDWLEIPNLRARGLAWVAARLRRRRPSWRELDREGRLVALYGMLAVAWLIIAVNLGVRIWTDRISGLVIGLWRYGFLARLLLVVVVAALLAPVAVALGGWLARLLRRWRGELRARRDASDAPRRLAALRASVLGQLPAAALNGLAAHGNWQYPSPGQPIAFAGNTSGLVHLIVAGQAEARAADDPAGTIRERVGRGGLIGLASALNGAESALTWHVGADTVLLTMPAGAVNSALSPLPGPLPAERAEAENLFAETPALEGLSAEDRLGLAISAQPVILAPGVPVVLSPERDAVVIASGEVTLTDGRALRRGTLIGPLGDGVSSAIGMTRTPVRLWSLPAVGGAMLPRAAMSTVRDTVAALAAGSAGVLAAAGGMPIAGVHPRAAYPPLAVPPTPPPPGVDSHETDGRFEKFLWRLLLLLLLLGLLLTGSHLLPGPAWAEMAGDRALLRAERGEIVAVADGARTVLEPGDKMYVAVGDTITVADQGTATLTYRGGATTTLCPGAVASLDQVTTGARHSAATVALTNGMLVADTASRSSAFADLDLTVLDPYGKTVSRGAARHAVNAAGTTVAAGVVFRDDLNTPVPPSGGAVGCALTDQGVPVPTDPNVPPPLLPSATPSASPSASRSASPSPSVSPSPSPSASPSARPSTVPTIRPTVRPTRVPLPTPRPTTPSVPPGDRTGPTVTDPSADPNPLDQVPPAGNTCGAALRAGTTATAAATVVDDTDSAGQLTVIAAWSTGTSSGSARLSPDGNRFYGQFQVPYVKGQERGGTVEITITATDRAGNTGTASTRVTLSPCVPRPIIG